MALSLKKLKFATAYAAHGNGAQAIRDAGYAATNNESQRANKLLKQPEVAAKVKELTDERMAKFEVTGDKILEELAKIAFSDVTEFIGRDGLMSEEDFHSLTPEQRACIASVKRSPDGAYEVKLHDKLAALDKLGKSQKLFTDKVETEHTFTKMGSVRVGDQAPMSFDVGQAPDDASNTKH